MSIFFAILVFSIIILVHELGHFWAAKKAGIEVIEFSLGMGPRLLKFTHKGTIFSLKLFPIGGSCRMRGEDEEEKDENGTPLKQPAEGSFNAAPIGWRMIVIVGGAAMNFIFAFILAIILSMFNSSWNTEVHHFMDDSPVALAGMEVGDRIVRIDGRRITTRGDINIAMLSADGSPIDIVVDRNGTRIPMTITPTRIYEDGVYSPWLMGVAQFGVTVGTFASSPQLESGENYADLDQFTRASFFDSFVHGYQTVSFNIRATFTGLGRLIRYGFNFDELMGPIGIVDIVGGHVSEQAEQSGGGAAFWALINFTVLLSANLGVINLLPLPALDGGRMVFLTIEAIRKKPVPPEKEGFVHFAGLMLLLGLFVVVAYHDILRLFTRS